MGSRPYYVEEGRIPGYASIHEPLVSPSNGFLSWICPVGETADPWQPINYNEIHTMKVVDVEGYEGIKAIVCDVCDALLMILRNPMEGVDIDINEYTEVDPEGTEEQRWAQWFDDKRIAELINNYLNPSFPSGYINPPMPDPQAEPQSEPQDPQYDWREASRMQSILDGMIERSP